MPRRAKVINDDNPIINNASKKAIEHAMGRKVEVDSANESPIRDDLFEEEGVTEQIEPVMVEPVSDEVDNSFDEDIKKVVATTTPYGDNYYKIEMGDLPTKGKIYGGAEIYLRNFKVIEIKRLSTVDENTANDVINDVMANVVKGYDYGDIAAVDKVALLFYVRMNTFPDPKYKINFSCTNMVPDKNGEQKECGHANKLFFTANDLNVKQLSDDFNENDLKFNIPSGDEIKWRFPLVSDEKGILIAVDRLKLEFEKADGYESTEVDSDIVSYAYVIDAINGQTLSTTDKYIYITEVMTPQDFVVMTNEMNNRFDIGVDTMIKTTCSKCGGRVSVPVMFSPEFFLPEYTA